MNQTNDYPYIRKWGVMMGSHHSYINEQVALARQEEAPPDAIYYRNYEGRWATIEDITSFSTLNQLGLNTSRAYRRLLAIQKRAKERYKQDEFVRVPEGSLNAWTTDTERGGTWVQAFVFVPDSEVSEEER